MQQPAAFLVFFLSGGSRVQKRDKDHHSGAPELGFDGPHTSHQSSTWLSPKEERYGNIPLRLRALHPTPACKQQERCKACTVHAPAHLSVPLVRKRKWHSFLLDRYSVLPLLVASRRWPPPLPTKKQTNKKRSTPPPLENPPTCRLPPPTTPQITWGIPSGIPKNRGPNSQVSHQNSPVVATLAPQTPAKPTPRIERPGEGPQDVAQLCPPGGAAEPRAVPVARFEVATLLGLRGGGGGGGFHAPRGEFLLGGPCPPPLSLLLFCFLVAFNGGQTTTTKFRRETGTGAV